MNSLQRISLDGEIRDGRHFLAVRVCREDTDFTGFVYHANYLRYCAGVPTIYGSSSPTTAHCSRQPKRRRRAFAFVVRSMALDFLRPARLDDVLEIVTEPEVVKGL
jgi:acyl-CoA thioester hydrolase